MTVYLMFRADTGQNTAWTTQENLPSSFATKPGRTTTCSSSAAADEEAWRRCCSEARAGRSSLSRRYWKNGDDRGDRCVTILRRCVNATQVLSFSRPDPRDCAVGVAALARWWPLSARIRKDSGIARRYPGVRTPRTRGV